MSRIKLIGVIAAAAIGFLAFIVLVVMIGFWVGDQLGVEPSGERRSFTSYINLGISLVLLTVGALTFVSVRSWIQGLNDGAKRRRHMPSDALQCMKRYCTALGTSQQCVSDANERLVRAGIGYGSQDMTSPANMPSAKAIGKLSALRVLKENSRHISAEDRHTLARAAILMFLKGEGCVNIDGFREIIKAIGPLPGEAKRAVQEALAAVNR